MNNYNVLEYLYRDANNFKAFGQILVSGNVSDDYVTEIKSYLDSGEFFIAEQVNVPTLYSQLWEYSNGPTIADHAYHEFIELRSATDEEVATLAIWGDITALTSAFHKVGQQWDCTQSIHCPSI